VLKTQPGCVQKRASQRWQRSFAYTGLLGSTVERIADDRMTYRRKMCAKLVRAPGVRLCCHERKLPKSQEQSPVRVCFAAETQPRSHARSVPGIARNWEAYSARFALCAAVHKGKVGLTHGACAELLGNGEMRGVIASHNQRARCAAIQPMNDPRPQRAAGAGKLLQAMQKRIYQSTARHAGPWMYRHTCRLVHHDEVTILKQQFDWYFFRRGFDGFSWQYLDFHGFSGGQPVRRLCETLIDADVSRINQFLDSGAADLRQA
jgi:hypothetical protein